MSGDTAVVAMVVLAGLVGLAALAGIRAKSRPDRVRALAKAQQAYDLESYGRAAELPDYERQLRRQLVVTEVVCLAGISVALTATLLTAL